MQRLTNLRSTNEQVFQKITTLLSAIRSTIAKEPDNLEDGVTMLERLRQNIYEELNQIQHEAMIIRAARFLKEGDLAGRKVEWWWNPRQTSTED